MMISERIQAFIHKLETGAGGRWLNYLALVLVMLVLVVRYDTHCYHNFSSPEAMDAAQVARNLSEGKGFTTDFVRPFGISLLQKQGQSQASGQNSGTNMADVAQLNGRHPDLANAPLYPAVLAGLFKVIHPNWAVEFHKSFWAEGGRFRRYKADFEVALFNQVLLLVVVCMTFLLAKKLLDMPAAWLSALLMLCSDELWKFSVSGLPTLLLLIIFLGLAWCLVSFGELGDDEAVEPRRRMTLAAAAGFLTGLGMLTRYSFGWLIIPVAIYFILYGGHRRTVLVATACSVFVAMGLPWILRNLAVCGAPFGTAGYALLEDSNKFPGSYLMQSVRPEMFEAYRHIGSLIMAKLSVYLGSILQNGVLRVGGGWVGILFLAGTLLGLRNVVARRLRYFALSCLGLFVLVTALGQTPMSDLSPEFNTENQLVLLMPLAVIFGSAFFLTVLDQMNLPFLGVRYVVIGLAILLVRAQFALALLPSDNSPAPFPPYSPPYIQRFCKWMEPDDLIMSDIPWAVAWYGDRQCTWTTINCRHDFNEMNSSVKQINALYLSLNTLDEKLLTECYQTDADSWGRFSFNALAFKQLPNGFPLTQSPPDGFVAGLFIADRKRWQTE